MIIKKDFFLIRPDAVFMEDNIKGVRFKLSDSFTPERRLPVFGEVLQVPEKISDYRAIQEELRKKKDPYSKWKWRDYNEIKLEDYTDREVIPIIGDRVMFSFQFLLDPDENTVIEINGEKLILIRYDFIYAIEEEHGLRMLHGFQMTEPVIRKGKVLPRVVKVVYGDLAGELIVIGKRDAVRNEYVSHKKHGDSNYSLARIHKSDVKAIVRTIPKHAGHKDNEIFIYRDKWPMRLQKVPGLTNKQVIESNIDVVTGEAMHIEGDVWALKDSKIPY